MLGNITALASVSLYDPFFFFLGIRRFYKWKIHSISQTFRDIVRLQNCPELHCDGRGSDMWQEMERDVREAHLE